MQSSRLARLPSELRSDIYSLVFEGGVRRKGTIRLQFIPEHSGNGNEPAHPDIVRLCLPKSQTRQSISTLLAITRTCKDIRNESLDSLFSSSTVIYLPRCSRKFDFDARLVALQEWFQATPFAAKTPRLALSRGMLLEEEVKGECDFDWWTFLSGSTRVSALYSSLQRLTGPIEVIFATDALERVYLHVSKHFGQQFDMQVLNEHLLEYGFVIPLWGDKAVAHRAVDNCWKGILARWTSSMTLHDPSAGAMKVCDYLCERRWARFDESLLAARTFLHADIDGSHSAGILRKGEASIVRVE